MFVTFGSVAILGTHSTFGQDSNTTSGSPSSSGGVSGSSMSAGPSSGTVSSSSVSASNGAEQAITGGPANGTSGFSKLPFELTLNVREGYDDNPDNASNNKQSSWFTNGGIDVAYDFGDPRLQLNLVAGAGGTYYYEHIAIQDYDIDLHGGLNITYKANPRLTLSSKLYLAYLTEPNFTYGSGINARVGNYFFTTDQFTAAYQWLPRFSTATSYTIDALNYDSSAIGQSEDRVENTFGNEFRFLLVPTTTLVAEYRYEIVSYLHSGNNDSTTHYLLGGIDHNFTPRFLASLRAGAQFRDYDQTPNRTEPYVEATVTYASGKSSSLSWTTRYGLEEPDFVQVQSRTTFRTGLQIKQELMSRFTAQLGLYYQHDDNQGSATIQSFTENSVDVAVSAHYAITHYLGLEAGYNYTDVTSGFSALEYNRNRVFAGLNFAF